MRRSLALAFVAATVLATPAVADDPVHTVKQAVKDTIDRLDDCMDCVPAPCQVLASCAKP